MAKQNRVAVVDGANVAYIERSEKGDPKISNLIAVREVLEKKGYRPVIIVDATLIYEIDDRKQLDALIEKQEIRQAPAGTDADNFVLELADEYGALVISNDRFEPYQDRFSWIHDRRVPLMIVNGQVELYEPKLDARE